MRRLWFAGFGSVILGVLGQAASSLSLTPPPNAYGWHNTPVTVTITGTGTITWRVDGGPENSGPSPVEFVLSTEGVHGVQYRDETEATLKQAVIRLDFTPPRIQIRVPDPGGRYILRQPVPVDWSAWDELSGLAEVRAAAERGEALDTRSPGQQRFWVRAVDRAGNTAEATACYHVHGLLQAALPSGFYLNRAIPPEEAPKVGRYRLGARYTVGEELVFAFVMKDYYGQVFGRAWPEITVVRVRLAGEEEEYPLRAWIRVPFDLERGIYIVTIHTKDYEPGFYDLWVMFGDGQFERIRIELVPKP